ncbi:MAG: hypothetical protein FWF29_08715 [Treponema sp.]|nr:hypothetical protein [Treponema sp.]
MANKSKKTWFFYGVFMGFLWVWQFPQHLLALILWGILSMAGRVVSKECKNGKRLITLDTPGFGVSLGMYVLMDEQYGEEDWRHEFGHGFQSLWLGPLYLLVVGIASAVFNNLWDRLFHKNWPVDTRLKWYYSRYPEHWADKLGGVIRPWE